MISVILPTYRINNKEKINKLEEYRQHIESIDNPPTEEFIELVQSRLSGINHFLDISLKSLESQTKKNDLEVLLCHKYPDDVKDLVKDYNLNIQVIKEKDSLWHTLGDYPTVNNIRNTGIIHSTGELILFLDDYSIFNKYLIENILDNWNRGYTTTFRSMRRIRYRVSGESEYDINGNIAISANRSHFIFGNMTSGFNFTAYKFGDIIPQQSTWTYGCTVSKEDCLAINGFDEIYDGSFGGTDEDFGLRLAKNGSKYTRVLGKHIIYEFGHGEDTKRKHGMDAIRIDRQLRYINRQYPTPRYIRANSWKPTPLKNEQYKKWHLEKFGSIDKNWDKFMDVPLYNLEEKNG